MTSNVNTNDDTIDLKELFFSLIAQWKVITLCIILSLICAILYLRSTPNVYDVDALVQIAESKGASSALLGNLSGMIDQKSPAQTEIEIIQSRKTLGQVIRNYHLDIRLKNQNDSLLSTLIENNHSINVHYATNGVVYNNKKESFLIKTLEVPQKYLDQGLLLQFNKNDYTLSHKDKVVFQGKLNQAKKNSSSNGIWNVDITAKNDITDQFTLTKLALPTAVNNLTSNLKVAEQGKLTGIINFNYQGQDKVLITSLLNNILNVYNQQNVVSRSLESAQTLEFLNKKLPELKSNLNQSEIAFNDFRHKNNTVNITQESELLLKQNIALETTKLELQQKQAELSAKYTADHPLMTEINSQLKTVNNKISEIQTAITRLPELQRQYMQLYRDVEVQTQLYTELMKSYQQLQIVKAGEIGNVRILDYAIEPVKPIKPRKLIVLILSIFVGGLVGILIALVRNMMQSGVKDSSQIESFFNLPVYATVPRSPYQLNRLDKLKKQKVIPILAEKNSEDIAIESLRSIRTALHFTFMQAKNNVMLITGPAPSIGKSFVSTNLAVILAQTGKKVLLIDADLRRGYLHKYFGVSNEKGLAEHLIDNMPLESVIKSTNIAGLDFLNRGRNPSNPAELLSSDKFRDFLANLNEVYDHILIDSPPVLAVTDSIIISQYAAVNLIVARYNQTALKELEITVNRFEQAGTKATGFILNDVQKSFGGNYAYNYAYTSKVDD
ncbi:polysaccharide biosynthesis tyrosine autokinase [Acinetobacter silvestris]|uniref:Tyrosine protein kinase n=1 Tax=Acinetobacter silvestris TaxID=1977882 RepID=A0A1Y3C9T6_9GAMM|nr:polysaccharide biosynthesis tyrosine autokinase [Acinetobacter silvestris]OTG63828.1 tyrosine protein kinase [Acinetobacter silvestris]